LERWPHRCGTIGVRRWKASASGAIAALLGDQPRRERLGEAARATAEGFGTAAFLARFDAMLEWVTQTPAGGAPALDDAGTPR